MSDSRYDKALLFEAFIKSTQYIARIKTQLDFWDHTGKFILTYFPADWTALVQRDPAGGLSIHHCTLPDAIAAQLVLNDKVRTLIADVLDSGFFASHVIAIPYLSMTVFLPLVKEHHPEKALLIGHETADPLPHEVLNIYLAIADLAGTTFERLQNEWELNRHRAHLEELVKERTAEVEAANKELEAFSYSVSHDLRAPLRSIAGFSQVLFEDHTSKLDEEGKDAVNRILAATYRMGQLIDDLLNLSRVSRTEMRQMRVDLSAIARENAGLLAQMQPERKTEFRIAEGIFAMGDERLLRVVLDNLLSNAWKFTGKNSLSQIEFGITSHEGEPANFVKDNGAGFDMTYAGKLFCPFQRLHTVNEFPGTGIGLATVRRIIERHGGRVWIEGQVDKGATVYFTLP